MMIIMIIITIIWLISGIKMMWGGMDEEFEEMNWSGIIFLSLAPLLAFWGTLL